MSHGSRLRKRHIRGQAYAFAALTPIRAGGEHALADDLRGLPKGPDSPLARVPTVHFARFVIVDLPVQQLLFTSVFDGTLDAFLATLCAQAPEAVDAIWGRCVGFPGSVAKDPAAFRDWMRIHELETGTFFAPYGEHTVAHVRAALALRTDLRRFAAEMQDAEPADLRSAFERTFVTGRRALR